MARAMGKQQASWPQDCVELAFLRISGNMARLGRGRQGFRVGHGEARRIGSLGFLPKVLDGKASGPLVNSHR